MSFNEAETIPFVLNLHVELTKHPSSNLLIKVPVFVHEKPGVVLLNPATLFPLSFVSFKMKTGVAAPSPAAHKGRVT